MDSPVAHRTRAKSYGMQRKKSPINHKNELTKCHKHRIISRLNNQRGPVAAPPEHEEPLTDSWLDRPRRPRNPTPKMKTLAWTGNPPEAEAYDHVHDPGPSVAVYAQSQPKPKEKP